MALLLGGTPGGVLPGDRFAALLTSVKKFRGRYHCSGVGRGRIAAGLSELRNAFWKNGLVRRLRARIATRTTGNRRPVVYNEREGGTSLFPSFLQAPLYTNHPQRRDPPHTNGPDGRAAARVVGTPGVRLALSLFPLRSRIVARPGRLCSMYHLEVHHGRRTQRRGSGYSTPPQDRP